MRRTLTHPPSFSFIAATQRRWGRRRKLMIITTMLSRFPPNSSHLVPSRPVIAAMLILGCCCVCPDGLQSAQQELTAVRVTLAEEEQKNAVLTAQVRLHLNLIKAFDVSELRSVRLRCRSTLVIRGRFSRLACPALPLRQRPKETCSKYVCSSSCLRVLCPPQCVLPVIQLKFTFCRIISVLSAVKD